MQSRDPYPLRQEAASWLRDDRHGFALAALMWVLIALMIVPEGLDYGAKPCRSSRNQEAASWRSG